MIKYEREYKETLDKEDFVELCLKRKLTTEKNARKRYSDLKRKFGLQTKYGIVEPKKKVRKKKQVKQKKQKTLTVDGDGYLFINVSEIDAKGLRIKFVRTEGRTKRTVGLQIEK